MSKCSFVVAHSNFFSVSDFSFNLIEKPEGDITSLVQVLEFLQNPALRTTTHSWSLVYLLLAGVINMNLPDPMARLVFCILFSRNLFRESPPDPAILSDTWQCLVCGNVSSQDQVMCGRCNN